MQLYTISLLSEEAGSELGKRHGPGRTLQHSLTTIYLYLSGHRLDWLKSAHFEGLDTGGKTLTRVLNKRPCFTKHAQLHPASGGCQYYIWQHATMSALKVLLRSHPSSLTQQFECRRIRSVSYCHDLALETGVSGTGDRLFALKRGKTRSLEMPDMGRFPVKAKPAILLEVDCLLLLTLHCSHCLLRLYGYVTLPLAIMHM